MYQNTRGAITQNRPSSGTFAASRRAIAARQSVVMLAMVGVVELVPAAFPPAAVWFRMPVGELPPEAARRNAASSAIAIAMIMSSRTMSAASADESRRSSFDIGTKAASFFAAKLSCPKVPWEAATVAPSPT